jgi:Txe/YoeB family toxin of Txe-Axe toxin-antitoxin module
MGHPATHCGKKSNSNEDDDSSAAATVNSVNKLQKDIKSMRKAFTTVKTQLEKLKEVNPTFLSRKVKTKHHLFKWMQPSNSRR